MIIHEKIIRDPVHDVIAFRLDRAGEALLFRLLGAAEVQRLRRIRQLGMASLAYPGADHSRYSHSIGVMQTARCMLDHVGGSFYIADEQRVACLAAALLHDLGHGPFSHVFERVSGVEHETLTRSVVLDPESEVHQLLREYDASLPRQVVDLMDAAPSRSVFSDILSSQLDADRLDYLLRDNLMTGSHYGDYDLTWLLHALTVDEASQRLAVTWKGISAVEAYLQSRFHMYRNVYFHKVVRSGEGMVKLALQRARRLAVQDRLVVPGREDPVAKALLGRQMSVREFTDLDDVSVTHCFKVWADSEDETLARLCRGLLFRQLFKTIDVTSAADSEAARRAVASADAAIVEAGGEAGYELFYDEPADTPYETPDEIQIMVRQRDGTLKDFASLSPMTQPLNRQLMFRRIHVAPQWHTLAQDVIEKSLRQ